jgi:cation:H+ antiporter
VVGLTVIAVGTSIPDCAASIIAVTKNQKGIAVGNILGSNIFNIFLVLGATILAFNDPIFFSRDNLYDYLSISILSLFFFLAMVARQSCGRLLGAAILAYYPLALMMRMFYLG